MKIGFFGGSFNPPTNAHIMLAEKIINECKLDKVIFVPMGDFYPKNNLAKSKDRFNMLKIACKDKDNMEVSDIELKSQENLHAIDAFMLIEKNYPNDDRYFIMGADNFVNIKNWKESEMLINNYKFIVIEREKINLKEYIEKNYKKQKENFIVIENSGYKDHSSSNYRNNNMQDIIPEKVLEYIKENAIY